MDEKTKARVEELRRKAVWNSFTRPIAASRARWREFAEVLNADLVEASKADGAPNSEP